LLLATAPALGDEALSTRTGSADPLPNFRADVAVLSPSLSTNINRTQDAYVHVTLEAEVPFYRWLSLSIRVMPVFLYRQSDGTGIFGMGFGANNRFYFRDRVHEGTYLELGAGPLWAHRYFVGNASRLNILSEFSAGYKFPNGHWHLAGVFEHISNGLTTTPDHGINALGVLAGADF
jgi:hypothetical protein